jgi:hypothetical protein
MFVLLVLQFKSYVQPLLILAVIPFGMIGAVWGHAAVGLPLTLFSMFGLVALAGVVVNDSIVLIDFINTRDPCGSRPDGSVDRIRPTPFPADRVDQHDDDRGLAPLLTERSFQAQLLIPMAASLAFGLMVATVLVLLLIPCFTSLDTLDAEVFRKISRRDDLSKTIAGIDAAIAAGFDSVKLNALAIAGVTEDEVARLVRFAIDRGVTMRFIEFMPLDTDRAWTKNRVLSGDELLSILKREFGDVQPIGRSQPSQPAEEFLVDSGRVGIIRSVTRPFCSACNRIRLTADGAIRNCLFASEETPLRDALRSGATDGDLMTLVRHSVAAKKAAHGIDDEGFVAPDRPMYSIGG